MTRTIFPVLVLFFVSFFSLVAPPVSGAQVNSMGVSESSATGYSESKTGSKGLWFLSELKLMVDHTLHPVREIYSPLPLRLGRGVLPHPEVIFEVESANEDVLGVRTSGEPQAPSVFVRGVGSAKEYSLTGDFLDTVGEKSVGSRHTYNLSTTKLQSRGEIWGARIAKMESEVSSWFNDSGVTITFLVTVGALLLALVIMLARKILRGF